MRLRCLLCEKQLLFSLSAASFGTFNLKFLPCMLPCFHHAIHESNNPWNHEPDQYSKRRLRLLISFIAISNQAKFDAMKTSLSSLHQLSSSQDIHPSMTKAVQRIGACTWSILITVKDMKYWWTAPTWMVLNQLTLFQLATPAATVTKKREKVHASKWCVSRLARSPLTTAVVSVVNDIGFTSEIGATCVPLPLLRTSRSLVALVLVLLALTFVIRPRQVSKASNFWWNRAFIVAMFLDHDHDNRNTKTSGLSRMPYNDKKMKPKRVGRLFVAAAVIASRHTTIKNTAQMGSMSMSSIRNTGRNMPQEELLATLKRCQG